MDDATLKAEIDRMEDVTADWEPVKRVVAQCVRAWPTFAGLWVDPRRRRIHVTVTAKADALRSLLHARAPSADVRIDIVAHTYAQLQKLAEEILRTAETVGAPLSSIDVDECHNSVQVGLVDLKAAASVSLMEMYAGQPVGWFEGDVVLG